MVHQLHGRVHCTPITEDVQQSSSFIECSQLSAGFHSYLSFSSCDFFHSFDCESTNTLKLMCRKCWNAIALVREIAAAHT